MIKNGIWKFLAIGVLLSVPAQAQQAPAKAEAPAAPAVQTAAPKAPAHWTYEGEEGPAEWGAIDPAYAACKLGHEQSPIDIQNAQEAALESIQFDYKAAPLKVLDNGHTIVVNYAAGSSISVGGHKYELKQFHFHRPSEEKVNGKSFELVAHLVHADAEGKLAVVAVLFDKGAAQATVQSIWEHLPKEKKVETAAEGVTVNAADLLPAAHGYYTFMGSLTTPPCSEGVTWFVLKTPAAVSAAQVEAFSKIYPLNARPTQPLGSRIVKASK